MIGNDIHNLATALWPIARSITGDGVRQTLDIIGSHLPGLRMYEVPSGTKVCDWIVPKEWTVRNAWIITPSGEKICDFHVNNLHLLGYSSPVNKKLTLSELNNHLFSLPEQPNAIPYITSYYKERWGFCLTHEQRGCLEEGEYQVLIDSDLFDGSLTYGELILKGESTKEVFISTYVCHPSMANNELSGPCVTTFLAKWLIEMPSRKYTYRIIFIPETIGAIAYLAANLQHLKTNVIAGFNVGCVGDNRNYSYLPTKKGNTYSDLLAQHVLKNFAPSFKSYEWTTRGGNERQYCAPHVDLPIASMMRSKYAEYPEYHTSLDDLVRVVTPDGLWGGYEMHRLAIEIIEKNCFPSSLVIGEPQLGKRGLYPTLSTKKSHQEVSLMLDLISWSDGSKSLLEIANLCNSPIWKLYPILEKLIKHKILEIDGAGYSSF